MVLAGLVLKLATYGILRISIPILPEATAYFTPLAYTFAIISIIYDQVCKPGTYPLPIEKFLGVIGP